MIALFSGLPVTLARAGLTPFLLMLTICLVAQVVHLYYCISV